MSKMIDQKRIENWVAKNPGHSVADMLRDLADEDAKLKNAMTVEDAHKRITQYLCDKCDWHESRRSWEGHLLVALQEAIDFQPAKAKVKADLCKTSSGWWYWKVQDCAGPVISTEQVAKLHLESIMAAAGATVVWEKE